MADTRTVAAILTQGLMPAPPQHKPGWEYSVLTDIDHILELGQVFDYGMKLFQLLVGMLDDPEPARKVGFVVPTLTKTTVVYFANYGDETMYEQDNELISAIITSGLLAPLKVPARRDGPKWDENLMMAITRELDSALRIYLLVLATLKTADELAKSPRPSHPPIPKHGRRHS